MIDPTTPPSTKARAADNVLDHSAKAIEIEDIEARVSEWSGLRKHRNSIINCT